MSNFSIIVAMAPDRSIGGNNQLLWHLPNDLKHFKATTMGKPIVMGRKTFESIGKPLPGRENIVISRDIKFAEKYKDNQNLKIFNNIENLKDYCKKNNYAEIMIIGGGEIYELFLPISNKIYLTTVDIPKPDYNADIFFPELDSSWEVISKQSHTKDEKHKYDYKFIELFRAR